MALINASYGGAYGGAGNDILVATTDHDVLYGGAGSDSFVLSKNVMNNYNAIQAEGYSMLGIADFHSASANPANGSVGTGEQDYIGFRGFSTSAQVVLQWANPADASGGRYMQYSVVDGGQHYDFVLYSNDGAALVQHVDYDFYYG